MVILGNVFSLLASLFMVSIGLIRDKRKILLAQCSQFTLAAVGNFLLGAFSGGISNLLGVVRNLVFLKVKATAPMKAAFIALQCFLTLYHRAITPLDFCPILATVIFTCFVDAKKAVHLKCAIIVCQVLWGIYDLCYLNYAAFAFDIMTIFSNLAGIAAIFKAERRKGAE